MTPTSSRAPRNTSRCVGSRGRHFVCPHQRPLDVARPRGLCLTASCHFVRPLPVPPFPMHPATYHTCVQPSLREGVMRPEVEFDHGGDLGLGAGHKSGYSDVSASSSSSSVPLTTMVPVADDDAII